LIIEFPAWAEELFGEQFSPGIWPPIGWNESAFCDFALSLRNAVIDVYVRQGSANHLVHW